MTGGLSEDEVLAIIQQLEDGNNVGIGDDFVYCFAEGSRLRTPGGEIRVERLSVGDMVDTLDHGPQAIRWIGRSGCCRDGRSVPDPHPRGSRGATVCRAATFWSRRITGWS